MIMDMPGDWHADLSMAQSIFNVCYTGFLDEFQDLLGWKHINSAVSKCYFQSTRLITFVHDELLWFFTHQFVAERTLKEGDESLSDGQYLTMIGWELQSLLTGLNDSDDKWIATCGVFLELAFDFLEFVDAYRIGDAVAIEYGYSKHSTVWKALCQNKYVEIFLSQQETLYRDFQFSQLQELRMNRVVRRYHGTSGKSCVVHDEFFEHGNRFFQIFLCQSI